MIRFLQRVLIPFLLIALFFSQAHAAPKVVQELADKTAATVGVISAQIQTMAKESRQLAEARAANIARLHAANTRLRGEYNYDLELTKKAGGQANLKLIEMIEKWGEQVRKNLKAADNAEAERKEAILSQYTKLDTISEKLGQIAQALAALAAKEKTKDRIRFLVGYAKELKAEIDKQRKQGDKSFDKAKELLEKLKKKK